MITTTVEEILNAVRFELGDRRVPGGEVFTNDFLFPFFARAYEEMTGRLDAFGAPRIRRTVYVIVPPRTSRLTVADIGVTDFAFPEAVYEKGRLSKAEVASTTPTAPVVVTAPGHNLDPGYEVYIVGVGAEINGRWFVTVIDSSSFSLNGSRASAAYTGGHVVQSKEDWVRVESQPDLSRPVPAEHIQEYSWRDGMMVLGGAVTERLLRISYISDGTVPTTGEVAVPGSYSFLTARTAMLAGQAKDLHTRAAELQPQADLALYRIIQTQVRSMQSNLYRPQPFRRRGGSL